MWTEQSERHDPDPTATTVGLRTRVQHHRVGRSIAETLAQPDEVADVTIIHHRAELDLDGDDAATFANDSNRALRKVPPLGITRRPGFPGQQGANSKLQQPGGEGTVGEVVLRPPGEPPAVVATGRPARNGTVTKHKRGRIRDVGRPKP